MQFSLEIPFVQMALQTNYFELIMHLLADTDIDTSVLCSLEGIYAVKLLSGPSLGFLNVIIWSKLGFLNVIIWSKFVF